MAQDPHEIAPSIVTRHQGRKLPQPPKPPESSAITVTELADEQLPSTTKASRLKSTEHQLTTQIVSLITETGSSGAGQINLTAQIPFQFAQAMMAFGSAIFSSQMKTPERIVQVTQGVISAVRLALSIAMIVEDEPCMDNGKKSPLCKSVLIFNLLYIGVITVATSVAASSQEKPLPPSSVPSSNS